jgi:hypothetical protein
VAGDGPRDGYEGDRQGCDEARRIATTVSWPCEVKTLFRDQNLGCKLGVSGAIDWFFEHEEEGIIVEDDVLPLQSFFPYCDLLLEKYRENEKIAMVSGCNLISHKFSPRESYFLSRNIHVWGWASWRRAWRYYDVEMKSWPRWRDEGGLMRMFPRNRLIRSYWNDIYNAVHRGKIGTWDYQWNYACWKSGTLSVLPATNLTRNIGFGSSATHTSGGMPSHVLQSSPKEATFPLIHPETIEPDETADNLIFKWIYGITLRSAVKRWLRNAPIIKDLRASLKGA